MNFSFANYTQNARVYRVVKGMLAKGTDVIDSTLPECPTPIAIGAYPSMPNMTFARAQSESAKQISYRPEAGTMSHTEQVGGSTSF